MDLVVQFTWERRFGYSLLRWRLIGTVGEVMPIAATKDKARTEAGFVADVESSINEFVASTGHSSNVIGLHRLVWALEFHSGYENNIQAGSRATSLVGLAMQGRQ